MSKTGRNSEQKINTDAFESRYLLKNAPIAFAYHKIITDKNGVPVDYVFLEANETYEKITGLKRSRILNKRLSEAVPELTSDTTNWIKVFGEVAIHQKPISFEQHSESLNRTFKIQAYSPEKFYFVVIFTDITAAYRLTEIAPKLNQCTQENIDYQEIIDVACLISGASYGAMNVFRKDSLDFSTVALSGLSDNVKKITSIIGFNPSGKVWKHDQERYDLINKQIVTKFDSLSILMKKEAPSNSIKMLEKAFSLGEVIIIKTSKGDKVLGDFTLFFKRGAQIQNQLLLETFASLVGSVISRLYAEQEIKEREENLRTFYDHIPDIVVITDMQGKILSANRAATERLGFTLDELYGQKVLDIHPLIYSSEVAVLYQKLQKLDSLNSTIPFLTNGEMIVPVETRYKKGKWNNKDSIISISNDLTKEHEALLKFNKVFQHNPAAMMICTYPELNILEVNRALTDHTGLNPDHIGGKSIKDINIFINGALDEIISKIDRENGVRNREVKLQGKGDQTLEGLISAHTIESQGKVFVLFVVLDITPLKEAEESARKANLAKSQFLANMSHEIRTPLNAVIGFTELLMKSDIDSKYLNYIKFIRTAGDSLLNTVNDILDFSKIEQGKIEIVEEKSDIVRLAEESADLIALAAAKKGLEFILNIQNDIPRYALLDAFRVKQILNNLLSNAVKFTEIGEVELSISFETNNNFFDQGSFLFQVRDTGIGISPDKQQAMFKAFTQADLSITRKYGGTGLGLVIAENLARKMESTIQLKSAKDEGSTFSFLLKKPFFFDKNEIVEKFEDLEKIGIFSSNARNGKVLQYLLRSIQLESIVIDEEINDDFFTGDSLDGFDLLMIDHNLIVNNSRLTIFNTSEDFRKRARKRIGIIILSDQSEVKEEISTHYDAVLKKPFMKREVIKCLKDFRTKLQEKHMEKTTVKNVEVTTKPVKQNKNMNGVILTAEDFNASKQLIHIMITRAFPDIKVIEADNGVEAVKYAIEHKPDIIFMDIHMPLKDGYAATREIREAASKDKNWNPKIVALTADVTSDIRQKCENAGMDEYMKKPFSMIEMKAYISEVLGIDTTVRPEKPNGTARRSDHHDMKSLMEKIGNSKSAYDELIGLSLKQIDDELSKMEVSVKEYEVEEAVFIAHSIKGLSLNMYFNTLADIAKRIELQQFNTREELQKLFWKLQTEYKLLKEEIRVME